jgi:hypothetical protein
MSVDCPVRACPHSARKPVVRRAARQCFLHRSRSPPSTRTFIAHDDMYGEGALNSTSKLSRNPWETRRLDELAVA